MEQSYFGLLPFQFLKSRRVNLFLANGPILYPLKTPENLWLSGVFRGYKMGTLGRDRLKKRRQSIL